MANHHFPWHEAFLAALRSMPVVQHACDAVGIQRSTAYRAREADEAFAQAWDDAMEAGIDRAEQEALRRGMVGFEEPVVYQGQLTPVWKRDDEGNVVMRKRERTVHDPVKGEQTFTEQVPVQQTDEQGRPVWLTVRKHSDALLALVLKARRKAYSTERTEHVSPDGSMSPLANETDRSARAAQLLAAARERREAQGDDFSDLA